MSLIIMVCCTSIVAYFGVGAWGQVVCSHVDRYFKVQWFIVQCRCQNLGWRVFGFVDLTLM